MSQVEPLPDRLTPIPQSFFAESYGLGLISSLTHATLFGIAVVQVSAVGLFGIVHTVLARLTLIVDQSWYSRDTGTKAFRGMVTFLYEVNSVSIHTSDKGHLENHLCLYFYFVKLCSTWPWVLFQLWDILKLQTIVKNLFVPMMVLRVAIDLLICGCLPITLHESRTEISSLRMGQLINTLIIYAFNRFLLTTMAVMGMTIALIVNPRNVGTMTLESAIVHETVYINNFLASLNSRSHLRGIAVSLSTVMFDVDVPMSGIRTTRNDTPLEIVNFSNDADASKHSEDVDIMITREVISEVHDPDLFHAQKSIDVV
ncbi:hypothetical protein K435DRAFT_801868 [Dendrothele bispora CBS 962.96]|uniref:DUF6534 domain-containing protein n=1 Tax=Dendrothele bispora (strain CBS 962.96) TaxID=1314807 RepID=A0A4S8LNW0_DENBC|nr:hypothetical protein K435DRAFT_801868 [Dendrothele bispora CBS 962.96]